MRSHPGLAVWHARPRAPTTPAGGCAWWPHWHSTGSGKQWQAGRPAPSSLHELAFSFIVKRDLCSVGASSIMLGVLRLQVRWWCCCLRMMERAARGVPPGPARCRISCGTHACAPAPPPMHHAPMHRLQAAAGSSCHPAAPCPAPSAAPAPSALLRPSPQRSTALPSTSTSSTAPCPPQHARRGRAVCAAALHHAHAAAVVPDASLGQRGLHGSAVQGHGLTTGKQVSQDVGGAGVLPVNAPCVHTLQLACSPAGAAASGSAWAHTVSRAARLRGQNASPACTPYALQPLPVDTEEAGMRWLARSVMGVYVGCGQNEEGALRELRRLGVRCCSQHKATRRCARARAARKCTRVHRQ